MKRRADHIIRAVARGLLLLAGCGLYTGCGEGELTVDDGAKALVEASQALKAGDKEAAMQHLNRSIEAKPYVWAYVERAKLHGEKGNDDAARADVQAGLELEPNSSELKWVEEELKKPVQQRFKGPSPAQVK